MTKKQARYRLEHGARFPFDASDKWNNTINPKPLATKDWAHAAARGIIADLKDRGGIKHVLDAIDHVTRKEMVTTLAEIIREAFEEANWATVKATKI